MHNFGLYLNGPYLFWLVTGFSGFLGSRSTSMPSQVICWSVERKKTTANMIIEFQVYITKRINNIFATVKHLRQNPFPSFPSCHLGSLPECTADSLKHKKGIIFKISKIISSVHSRKSKSKTKNVSFNIHIFPLTLQQLGWDPTNPAVKALYPAASWIEPVGRVGEWCSRYTKPIHTEPQTGSTSGPPVLPGVE